MGETYAQISNSTPRVDRRHPNNVVPCLSFSDKSTEVQVSLFLSGSLVVLVFWVFCFWDFEQVSFCVRVKRESSSS